MLEYRLSGAATWTTQSASVSDREATIHLQESGSYDVRLRVTSQGGVTTETQPKPVGVGGKYIWAFSFFVLPHFYVRTLFPLLHCINRPLSSGKAVILHLIDSVTWVHECPFV